MAPRPNRLPLSDHTTDFFALMGVVVDILIGNISIRGIAILLEAVSVSLWAAIPCKNAWVRPTTSMKESKSVKSRIWGATVATASIVV